MRERETHKLRVIECRHRDFGSCADYYISIKVDRECLSKFIKALGS